MEKITSFGQNWLARWVRLALRPAHPARILTALTSGIILGTALSLVLRISISGCGLWLILALAVAAYGIFHPVYAWMAVAVVAGMILALVRVSGEMGDLAKWKSLAGRQIEASGIIAEDVDDGVMKLRDIEVAGVRLSGIIYIKTYSKADLWRGDRVTVRGTASEGFGNYAAAIWRAEVTAWERPEPGDILLRVRDGFAAKIQEFVPEEESQLGLAYLLGMRSGMTDELVEILRVVGLTHLVVASGTHLSILVEAMRKVFGKLSRLAGTLFAGIFVILFASMIGWTASITRAALVTILTLVTGYGGRKFQPWRLIILAMAITLMINPMNLTQLGWLLSFGAYAGIMLLAPKLTTFFAGEKKPGRWGEVLIASVSATALCLPLQLYFFGTFSLLSLPANLLILPTMPVMMGMIFATGCVGGICAPLGQVLGWLTARGLDFHLLVMRFLTEQRVFLLEMPASQTWTLWLYGLFLLPVLFGIYRRGRRARRLWKQPDGEPGRGLGRCEKKDPRILPGQQSG